MQPFTLLIKPVSSDCNLRCEYCFYLEKSRLYPQSLNHRMTDTVLEHLIRSYMATPQPVHTFGWQGGEPTLMGIDFFRRVTQLQQRHGAAGATVANGLQTNATRIDDEMARHFAEFRFLLGCSLDGPPELHDRFRRNAAGAPSHADALRGIETLRRHGVEFNILILVSQANVRHGRTVYRYLTEQGFFHHQYIPCVEFDAAGNLQPYAIGGSEWGGFLCEVFDEWFNHGRSQVHIRNFESLLIRKLDGQAAVCSLADNCCQYFVVEHNGDLYPCDFFVTPALKIGNILNLSWESAWNHPEFRAFGALKPRTHPDCQTCAHFELCLGDCLKHRLRSPLLFPPSVATGTPDPRTLSALCPGLRIFFDHTRSRLDQVAGQILRLRAAAARQSDPASPPCPPGRNDPCPCGSGLKHKKCCGR